MPLTADAKCYDSCKNAEASLYVVANTPDE